MYFKIALQNVRKSFQDYFIYFLTLAFSVCLFFAFNSFTEQQAVIEMTTSQSEIMKLLTEIMGYMSVFVAVVLCFLIMYANSFLVRRRKKEFGTYMLLGMEKSKMARILLYETFIIGLLSLVVGIVFGIALSQVLTIATASLFEVQLNYRFVFSFEALILTILCFGLVFFLAMLLNIVILSKFKLIDLLYADRKNEEIHIKYVGIYVLIFIVSLVCLGVSYYHAWTDPFNVLGNKFIFVVSFGCIGTLLFFLSLAGFMLRFVSSSKKLYYKGLNMFVLKEVNASIKSNFISMSFVCILLLLSIGALCTGLSLNATINKSLKQSTPYDVSVEYRQYREDTPIEVIELQLPDSVKDDASILRVQKKVAIGIPTAEYNNVFEHVVNHYANREIGMTEQSNYEELSFIHESDFNDVLTDQGYKPIEIKKNELVPYTTSVQLRDPISKDIANKRTLNVQGYTFSLKEIDLPEMTLASSPLIDNSFICVVDDEIEFDDPTFIYHAININAKDETKHDAIREALENEITEQFSNKGYTFSYFASTRQDIYDGNKGTSVIVTYVGIYLGIVFMLSSVTLLALQQLTKANDNKKRYLILNKIGADDVMMNRALFKQLCIYFFIPLALALVHSFVGIHFVDAIIMTTGRSSILEGSAIACAILLLIYGCYFVVTYVGAKKIIHSK
ncbi:putative ABC transport system permease protein [Breznakia blatticola]|uniref:Putative ABC transport system permease protein n=1 Tax=Breznakia blatticola TaxID=1754012 RepID=A0A4R7Z8Z2_9FIRM|nr:ABC transporter permease [Breznakia blatticola]TDW13162.1 putative ABC transport system permease protein [Breznakia blatticola]